MSYRKALLASASGLAMIGWAGAAQAVTTVAGEAWLVATGVAQNALVANKPLTTPNVLFTVPSNPLSMCSQTTGCSNSLYTLGGFLGSGGATGITFNGATSGTSLASTYWFFSGSVSVTHNETFNVRHDDGLELIIGGIDVINQPGPTSPTTTTRTYTGPAGNFAFSLAYGECCGPPAIIDVELPFTAAVPLPATLPLLSGGLGLLGLMGMRRKRKASPVAA